MSTTCQEPKTVTLTPGKSCIGVEVKRKISGAVPVKFTFGSKQDGSDWETVCILVPIGRVDDMIRQLGAAKAS